MAEKDAKLQSETRGTFGEVLPYIREKTLQLAVRSGNYTIGFARVLNAMVPLTQLVGREADVTEVELNEALDKLFVALKDHPIVGSLRGLTKKMRAENLLPNEKTTEDLLHYLIGEFTSRSKLPIPDRVTDEFWRFFNELMSEEELSGLGDVSVDALRILVSAYEPLLVDLANKLKSMRRVNDSQLREIGASVDVLRDDIEIFRRQLKSLRHIRAFFETDADDMPAQAEVVAQMVREFGPFFIKMAQIAAANAEFLPEEMADALAVFQEDVEPMTADEVVQAFQECYGQHPSERYYGFDVNKPIKSGSIASVYLAERPITGLDGEHRLEPVVVKVGRHNLEREFIVGKTVIKLAILSSRYWAPHSKIEPFLESLMEQVDVFVEGFKRELDFEAEAASQQRFVDRAKLTSMWSVPEVYGASRRIIEMQYVENPSSLMSAFNNQTGRKEINKRRKVGRSFLHAILTHLFIYREFHGDLHGGNVIVGKADKVHLIDWGNTVDLAPIWRPAMNYIRAVLQADAELIVDSLYDIAVNPKQLVEHKQELYQLVENIFREADVAPLGYDFARVLMREGQAGLFQRFELVMNILAAISRKGITVRGEFLHLSRSVMGMAGSCATIYRGIPKRLIVQDVMDVLSRFPYRTVYSLLQGYQQPKTSQHQLELESEGALAS